ncbi:hypothetical protein CIHG_08049 [Coccidioides immitis H538.4]|uniref:Uncharacterized protein n=3 Tax=Coccidioides immitis TaxID=5501 RepID=A0A0J8TN10_COCIT|nr:hypothetical protein CIRG_09020 [Coccidioides immitis RMSCC 2394]KMU75067.1 hypothetical protein CISG_04354 [Coccidioides immitis RMSCC 3703]KMU90239.1 hypothetical protein CIHG_08049 [Coccidioides immitis H538.4]
MLQSPQLPGPRPAFAKQLAPYIKTRDEVLKIRRALTVYLQAQVIFSDVTPASHISLCAPQNVAGIKRVPSEFSNGLRAQYLKAVQADIAARKEYRGLLEEVKALTERMSRCNSEECSPSRAQNFQTYLSLLRSRRLRSKIQICQHYLDKLNAMEAASSNFLDRFVVHQYEAGYPPGHGNHPDGLLYELERAVLVSKARVDNEKSLLGRIKAQVQLPRADQGNISPQARLKGLMRIRDELIKWVEHTLATSGMEDASNVDEKQTRNESGENEARLLLDGLKTEIEQQYAAYISARRKLLEIVSATLCIPMKPPSQPPRTRSQHQELEPSFTDFAIVFPYVHENLASVSKAQKTTAGHKSFLSAILSKEVLHSGKVLERLQNESHLLPKYPIPARHQRVKQVTTTINPRSEIDASPISINRDSGAVMHAEAWAFASGIARDSAKNHIDQQLAIGTEATKSADRTLRDIYETMNQNYEDVTSSGDAVEGLNEGVCATGLGFSRNRKVTGRLENPRKGPWSGLHGKIGVTD